ncbi:MAG TPA: hypothetical protein VF058_00235 [Actinomycetota bacterium]
MQIVNGDMSGNSCAIARRENTRWRFSRFRQERTWASCRFRARYVHPNKMIHWRVVSTTIEAERRALDCAPDAGWYP